jgi:hypothetical protein
MIIIPQISITFTPLVWKLWNNKRAYCVALLRAFWWHQKHREAHTIGKGYGDEH